MVDLLKDCLVDPYFEKRITSPEIFKRDVCSGCKNYKCVNAKGKFTLFEKRMSTQEDRLLTNPKFADPRDPRFRDIAMVDFPDMARQVVALEVTSRKKDWSVPTETEVEQLVAELAKATASTPLHFQGGTNPKGEWEVRGDSGKSYRVTLAEDGTWGCTCPSRVQPCKHVRDTALKLSRAPEEPTRATAQAPVLPPAMPPPGPVFAPHSMNTTLPPEGIMVGGARPTPKVDPWAPPAEKPRVVPVGGKVVFGPKK